MLRRADFVAGAVLVASLSVGLGCTQSVQTQRLEVGRHEVHLMIPPRWEHLDHGRQHLFRSGENQVSLADMGIATRGAFVQDLRHAETLWHSGRRVDALARVSELRSLRLRVVPAGRVGDFWSPWTDATYRADAADNIAIGAAFTRLIDGAAALAEIDPQRLLDYVLAECGDRRRREVAQRADRTIHGTQWVEVETWDRVSHLYRSRIAYAESGGYLLVLAMDHGRLEQAGDAFEALLASIEVTPAQPLPE